MSQVDLPRALLPCHLETDEILWFSKVRCGTLSSIQIVQVAPDPAYGIASCAARLTDGESVQCCTIGHREEQSLVTYRTFIHIVAPLGSRPSVAQVNLDEHPMFTYPRCVPAIVAPCLAILALPIAFVFSDPGSAPSEYTNR